LALLTALADWSSANASPRSAIRSSVSNNVTAPPLHGDLCLCALRVRYGPSP
jgi:hypothetical protein